MDAHEHLGDEAGLVVPAVELVDVTSDSDESPLEHDKKPGNGAPAVSGEVVKKLEDLRDAKDRAIAEEEQDEGDDDDDDEEEYWESESLYADALEGMGDQHLIQGGQLYSTLSGE